MQTTENASETRQRMRTYRARMRAAGLRPVQIWVPDVRTPTLGREARRQSLLAAQDAAESDSMAFIEDAADIGGSA